MTPESIQALITNGAGLVAMLLLMNYRLGKTEKAIEELKKEVVTKEFLEGKEALYNFRFSDIEKDVNNLGNKVRGMDEYWSKIIKKT